MMEWAKDKPEIEWSYRRLRHILVDHDGPFEDNRNSDSDHKDHEVLYYHTPLLHRPKTQPICDDPTRE